MSLVRLQEVKLQSLDLHMQIPVGRLGGDLANPKERPQLSAISFQIWNLWEAEGRG